MSAPPLHLHKRNTTNTAKSPGTAACGCAGDASHARRAARLQARPDDADAVRECHGHRTAHAPLEPKPLRSVLLFFLL
eukprot:868998-Prymnesium_polylepis.1